MLSNVVVTGGGTGGHVFTGIAVLDEVLRRNPSARTGFLGSSKGHEVHLVPRSGHEAHVIDARPLRLHGAMGALRALGQIPSAVVAAMQILRKVEPEVVLGVGGAASGPVLIAARMLGLRTALHEQNAVPGLANRLAGRFVSHILVGIPQVRGRFVARPDVVCTGNPTRAELLTALTGHVRSEGEALQVLVLGGSDGSPFLNTRVPQVLARVAAQLGRPIHVLHQAGTQHITRIEAAYAHLTAQHGAELVVRVEKFLVDMVAAYRFADLAITLAGAGTLAELALAGVPSVVVPLAIAADDHQRENAYHFARNGGIRVLDERDWTEARASDEVAELLSDRVLRVALGERFRGLATPGAAAAIVDQLAQS